MERLLKTVIVILALIFGSETLSAQTNDSVQEAQQLWELAVAAKGGRERLYNVRNLVVTSNSSGRMKKDKIRLESVYVFPDKWWFWDDQRPSRFGLSVSMYNWETGKQYVITDTEPNFIGLEQVSPNFQNTNLAGVTPDLLETKWNQPKPIRAFAGKVGSQAVDIVQTELLGKRIDFALDKETHLVVRVVAYSENQKPAATSKLADYIDVDGIKMPSTVIFENSDGDDKYKRQYRFNVEYNEDIFKFPPPLQAGSTAWQGKQSAPQNALTAPSKTRNNTQTDQPAAATPAEIKKLVKQLESQDEKLLEAAFDGLVKAGRLAVPFLAARLSHKNADVRLGTALILFKIEPENNDAIAALNALLRDERESEAFRRAVAFTLAGSAAGIGLLGDALANGDAFLRRSAVFAFDDVTERDLTAEDLAAFKSIEPLLQKAVRDKDEVVSRMASEVIGQLKRRQIKR